MLILNNIQKDFPILKQNINGKRIIYLDSSATSLKPDSVISAQDEYYTMFGANIHRGIYSLSEAATKKYDEARTILAGFINAARPEEIVFTRNATEGVNLLATSLGKYLSFKVGSIVATQLEHHANFVPWQQLALEKSIKFGAVPITHDGFIDHKKLSNYVNRATKVFAFAAVSNVLGTIQDIKSIVARVRELSPNCLIIIDASQAVPHFKIDVVNWGADAVVFSGHKMLGPTGIGVLWAKYDLLSKIPPYQFGGDMIRSVALEKTTFQDPPQKFEAGTPAISEAIGLAEACRYLNKIGMDVINSHELKLLEYAINQLKKIKKLTLISGENIQNRIGVIPFTIKGIHPHDIAQVLNEDNICIRAGQHCAMPLHNFLGIGATARASFYLYTTKEDIDLLVEGIQKTIKLFT